MTEFEKKQTGQVYDARNPELRRQQNRAKDLMRAYNSLPAGDVEGRNQLLSELSDCIPDRRDDYAQTELTEILNGFLRTLPREKRNLFLRRYWHCQSVEELARLYGMSQGAVKSSLFRIRNKLRAHLEKEGVGIE